MVNDAKLKIQMSGDKDENDKLFEIAISQFQCLVPVQKMDFGKYKFGTRVVLAKIVNGKLVIRVGGGYISVEEFLEKYAKIELARMNTQ